MFDRISFAFGCCRTEAAAKVREANLNFLALWYTLGRNYELHYRDTSACDQEVHVDPSVML